MCETRPHGFRLRQTVAKERCDEGEVFLAPGDELAHGEVVNFQAPAGRAARILIADRHQSRAPVNRESCRRFINAVCIVAEGLVKDRTLADSAINEDRILGTVARENISFIRDEQLVWCIGICAENRLAADHDDIGGVGIAGGGPDDVLKLQPIHVRKMRE